jgi:hypothetical protein
MLKGLSLGHIINYFREKWRTLPDMRRQDNNNLTYPIIDVALSAFSVFFMQSPSFLAHQRDMKRRKGKSNADTLFKIEQIPVAQEIRNLLDPIAPENFHAAYYAIEEQLRHAGYMKEFQGYAKTELVGLDGFVFHSSMKIHCDQCSIRRDRNGDVHYYHSAITPVIIRPAGEFVLSLPPEFIVPQDGHDKQDCEQAASKRWLATHTTELKAWSRTYLGDDLYAKHPLCKLINDRYKQYFIFVCKPDSHKTLYRWIEGMEKGGKLETKRVRQWNGRHGEIWEYRFATGVPIRADDGIGLNWVELRITHEETKEQIYKNSWITNHTVAANCVAGIAKAGRIRWKSENENNNILTTKGYHAKHNFGHGEKHLANTFLTLNILAFLIHTVQDMTNRLYRQLRQELGRRDTFFNDMQALTRYILFESWDGLWEFMVKGLEINK